VAAGKKVTVQTQLVVEASKPSTTRGSPRGRTRKERVVIPGERSSTRKRKGRGTQEQVPAEVLKKEEEEEEEEDQKEDQKEAVEEMAMEKEKEPSEFEQGVELDEDTFQKVNTYMYVMWFSTDL